MQLKRSKVLAPGNVCWQLKPWQWGCWVWHGMVWHWDGMAWHGMVAASGHGGTGELCLGGVGTQVINIELLQGPGGRHSSYRDILIPVVRSWG